MRPSITISILIAALSLPCFTVTHAAIITTNQLSYDTDTNIISGPNGLSYLGWGVIAHYDYAQTVTATSSTGAYSNYHIATQAEAYDFYNAAVLASQRVPDNIGLNTFIRVVPDVSDGAFGDNWAYWADYAWFLSEVEGAAGYINVFGNGNQINIKDYLGGVAMTDRYAEGGSFSHRLITWLLVADVNTVPEPATLTLLMLGLVGIAGMSRKKSRRPSM